METKRIASCDIKILIYKNIIRDIEFKFTYDCGKTASFYFVRIIRGKNKDKFKCTWAYIKTSDDEAMITLSKTTKYLKNHGYEMPTYHSIVVNLRIVANLQIVTFGSEDIIYKQENEPCPENVLDAIREIYPEEQVILM